MSEFYQTTHVKFIPVGAHYTDMLTVFRRKKWVEPIGENFWKLSAKGKQQLGKEQVNKKMEEKFQEVDKFIDKL